MVMYPALVPLPTEPTRSTVVPVTFVIVHQPSAPVFPVPPATITWSPFDSPAVDAIVAVTGVVLLFLEMTIIVSGVYSGTHNCTIATVLSSPGAVENQMPMKL